MLLGGLDGGGDSHFMYIRDIIIKFSATATFISHTINVKSWVASGADIPVVNVNVVGIDLPAVIVNKDYNTSSLASGYAKCDVSDSQNRQLWTLLCRSIYPTHNVRIIEPRDEVRALLAQIDDGLY